MRRMAADFDGDLHEALQLCSSCRAADLPTPPWTVPCMLSSCIRFLLSCSATLPFRLALACRSDLVWLVCMESGVHLTGVPP